MHVCMYAYMHVLIRLPLAGMTASSHSHLDPLSFPKKTGPLGYETTAKGMTGRALAPSGFIVLMTFIETSHGHGRQRLEDSPHTPSMADLRTWLSAPPSLTAERGSGRDDAQSPSPNQPSQDFSFKTGVEGKGFKGNLVATSEWRTTVNLIVCALFGLGALWLLPDVLEQLQRPPNMLTASSPAEPTRTEAVRPARPRPMLRNSVPLMPASLPSGSSITSGTCRRRSHRLHAPAATECMFSFMH